MEQITFDRVVSGGCGLDVHQKIVVATIDGDGIRKVTREFGTFTRSLTELRDWLAVFHIIPNANNLHLPTRQVLSLLCC
jgi:hypothetical protein